MARIRLNDPRWILILVFVAIIGSVPLIQAVLDIRQGDGVRAFEVFSQAPTAANLRAFEHSLESANWAARASRPWVQFARFKWLEDGGAKAIVAPEGWYFYKPGLNYMLARPGWPEHSGGTNDPFAAIVDFRDQLAMRGVKLIVMPVPNKESVYPDRLTSRAHVLRGVLAPRTRELLDRLRAADVEVIDLFERFGQARQQAGTESATSLYLAQDTHWSPAGVGTAATEAARRLRELGWIQSGQVDYGERPVAIKRLGDVLRMLQVPQIERSIEPETVVGARVVRQDSGELYKDAPEAEMLVLGDSFMRIYQEDAPMASGFISHLARELRQPLLALVNDGGGSTLVRQELQERPAFLKNRKVVLWEFVERDIGLGIEGWKLVPLPPVVSASPPGQTSEPADSRTPGARPNSH